MKKLHRLVERQINKHVSAAIETAPPDLRATFEQFFAAVSDAYGDFDADRVLLERSMELSSRELLAANVEMMQQNYELQAMYRIALLLNGDRPRNETCALVSEVVARATNYPIACIETFSEESQTLKMASIFGGGEIGISIIGREKPLPAAPFGAAFAAGGDIFVAGDLSQVADRDPAGVALGVVMITSAAIRSGGSLLGVLSVAHTKACPESVSLVDFLRTVSSVLGTDSNGNGSTKSMSRTRRR